MSNVTITIGARHYTVACGEGEEAHIERLGMLIDGKLAALPNMAGQSEPRTLLFAALLLADELHELGGRASGPVQPSPAVAESLEALADRLEGLASGLESTA